jgi:hypothetical protein
MISTAKNWLDSNPSLAGLESFDRRESPINIVCHPSGRLVRTAVEAEVEAHYCAGSPLLGEREIMAAIIAMPATTSQRP